MKLNELNAVPGSNKPAKRKGRRCGYPATEKRLAAATKARTQDRAAVFVRVLKAVRCLSTADCPRLGLPIFLQKNIPR